MHFDVLSHIMMLLDKTRMSAFETAVRKTVRKGDIVLDIGAGTGVLGFIALKYGARKLYAVEEAGIINAAKKIAEKNALTDKITFHESNSRNIVLPEKADVLLMELIGDAALNEDILSCAADARKRLLKENARIIPQKIKVIAAPVMNAKYAGHIRLKKICGLDLSMCGDTASNRLLFFNRKPGRFPLGYKTLFEFDVQNAVSETLPASSSAVFSAKHAASKINGLAVWFEAELCKGVRINSMQQDTHWAVVFLPFKNMPVLQKGDKLPVKLTFGKNVSCTWEASLIRKGREISHSASSTMLDGLLDADKILKLGDEKSPELNTYGYDALLVLEQAGKRKKVGEIIEVLMRKGKMSYSNAESAGQFVRKVLVKNIV